jgi:hypothetical protein
VEADQITRRRKPRRNKILFLHEKKKKNTVPEETPPYMEARLNLSNSDTFLWPEEFLDVQRERFCPDLCQQNIAIVYYDQSNPLLYQENVNEDSAWEAVLLISKTVPATPPTKRKRNWNYPHTPWSTNAQGMVDPERSQWRVCKMQT